jgi:chemotaxis protein methyltransferase CheR
MSVDVSTLTDWELWVAFIEQRCGLSFESRRAFLTRYLQAHAEAAGFRTTRDFYRHLVTHPHGEQEWQRLFVQLLNHETQFFRDRGAFDSLRTHVLSQWPRRNPRTPLRIWSAGCSTGQEAYSLVIGCLETDPNFSVCVTGTDVSTSCLDRAKAGRYRRCEIRGLSERELSRYFDSNGSEWTVNDRLRSRVVFRHFDLTTPEYDTPTHDVIFCQNVLIYYVPAVRGEIVRKLGQTLTIGGYLFLGPGEYAGGSAPGLESLHLGDAWVYRRS